MKSARTIKRVGSGSGAVPTRDCPIVSMGAPTRLNDPPGVRFDFEHIELGGPGWTTTLDDFCVAVRTIDADNLAVTWSAHVESPVRARLYDEGHADVVWFLCLYRQGIALPLAYFSDSFPRQCGEHVEGRPMNYRRHNGHDGRRWEWQGDIAWQLQMCDSAAGKFVHALNALECQ
jgi:hypothetical protein